MLQQWSLQDAKNKFSEVVNAACQGEPQLVTRRGEPAVVVLSADAYADIVRQERLKTTGFAQFLLSMPTELFTGAELEAEDSSTSDTFSLQKSLTLREVEW